MTTEVEARSQLATISSGRLEWENACQHLTMALQVHQKMAASPSDPSLLRLQQRLCSVLEQGGRMLEAALLCQRILLAQARDPEKRTPVAELARSAATAGAAFLRAGHMQAAEGMLRTGKKYCRCV